MRGASGVGVGRWWSARLATVATHVWLVGAACGGRPETSARDGESGLSLVQTLGGTDTVGFARAIEARDFVFPDDHGPHPDFRTEWWYVTANVADAEGRRFGLQLTIFRSSLAPTPPGGPSAWATNQAYMGHFAVTDVANARFHFRETFARGAAGLAGASARPFRVWIENWSLESIGHGEPGLFPLHLAADGDGAAIDLSLEAGKPLVLQGEDGLSRKSAQPGNASYYYSYTRLPAAGRVVVDGDTLSVRGLAWLDREWSTSALSSAEVGWDWIALQLDDGWELMAYRLRRADGSADPASSGILVDPDGRSIPLAWGTDVSIESTDLWRSPVDGAAYPSGWSVRVPDRGWDLTVEPTVRDQELRGAFRYWEGAVRVGGAGEGGEAVEGSGYVELTGHAGERRTGG